MSVKVKELVSTYSAGEFEGPLGELAQRFQEMANAYGAECTMEWHEGQYDDYSCYHLYQMRDETPEEQQQREEKENMQTKQYEERERALLAQLKEKYEGTRQ